jgi:hypothetical protein
LVLEKGISRSTLLEGDFHEEILVEGGPSPVASEWAVKEFTKVIVKTETKFIYFPKEERARWHHSVG